MQVRKIPCRFSYFHLLFRLFLNDIGGFQSILRFFRSKKFWKKTTKKKRWTWSVSFIPVSYMSLIYSRSSRHVQATVNLTILLDLANSICMHTIASTLWSRRLCGSKITKAMCTCVYVCSSESGEINLLYPRTWFCIIIEHC